MALPHSGPIPQARLGFGSEIFLALRKSSDLNIFTQNLASGGSLAKNLVFVGHLQMDAECRYTPHLHSH